MRHSVLSWRPSLTVRPSLHRPDLPRSCGHLRMNARRGPLPFPVFWWLYRLRQVPAVTAPLPSSIILKVWSESCLFLRFSQRNLLRRFSPLSPYFPSYVAFLPSYNTILAASAWSTSFPFPQYPTSPPARPFLLTEWRPSEARLSRSTTTLALRHLVAYSALMAVDM
jgi:hypothetical protein